MKKLLNEKILEVIQIERYEVSKKGLTVEQVIEREKAGLINKANVEVSNTIWNIFYKNIFTFFNSLFMIAILLFIIAGAPFSMYLFLIPVLINTATAIIQEIRTKLTLDNLKLINAPSTTVIRNDNKYKIKSEMLVLDDVIELNIGEQIPADCIVLSGQIEVNESLLTGESDLIKKEKDSELLSGSFVVSGKAYAFVNKIGNDCFVNKLQNKTKSIKEKKSVLLSSLTNIIKGLSFIIVPLLLFSFLAMLGSDTDMDEALLAQGALMTQIIPTGMFLLTTIALTVGVVRLSNNNTMVKDLYSIESLARIDTLCLDKTGTITDGTMTVIDTVILEANINLVEKIMGNYLNYINGNNQTNVALTERFKLRNDMKVIDQLDFSSDRKYSALTFEVGGTFILGAPEFIIKKEHYPKHLELANSYASKGYRVVVLATSANDEKINHKSKSINDKLIPYALFVIKDNIRETAADTIKWFKDNDVDIKIISGDNPLTVSRIAEQVGVDNADKCISLEHLTAEETRDAANRFTVFGRVSPEQKAILIKSLQDNKKNVAMTGDGVNDILALKTANCSIAMASGSEASKAVSQVVLMDSDFSNLPKVVNEGRRVINNIQLTSTLFLMKTFFVILMSIYSIIMLGGKYPFSTENFTIFETAIIGFSSLFLSLQKSSHPISGRFIKGVILNSISSALLIFFPVAIIFSIHAFNPGNIYVRDSMALLSMAVSGYILLIILCKPLNNYKKIVVIISMILGIGILLVNPDIVLVTFYSSKNGLDSLKDMIFDYHSSLVNLFKGDFITASDSLKYLNTGNYLLLVAIFIFGTPLYYLLSKMVNWTSKSIEKIKEIEQ